LRNPVSAARVVCDSHPVAELSSSMQGNEFRLTGG
jgi:hypothetical protein